MSTIITSVDDNPRGPATSDSYADLDYGGVDELQVKTALAREICLIIQARHFTQQRAASLLGVPPRRLAELERGKFHSMGHFRMIECLNRLGLDVEIVVRKAKPGLQGRASVLVAAAE